MSGRTTTTRNIWIASWFVARGLTLVRVERERQWGASIRCRFEFLDPDNVASRLTEEFYAHADLQSLVRARRVMGDAVDVARDRGSCEPGDVGLGAPTERTVPGS